MAAKVGGGGEGVRGASLVASLQTVEKHNGGLLGPCCLKVNLIVPSSRRLTQPFLFPNATLKRTRLWFLAQYLLYSRIFS